MTSTMVLRKINFNKNATQILKKRYLSENETPEFRLWNMCLFIASAEILESLRPKDINSLEHLYNSSNSDSKFKIYTDRFWNELIQPLNFLPNSPTIINAGKNKGSLSACYVVSPEDTMESILQTVKDWGLIEKYGGGIGGSFTKIRPKCDKISTTHGQALGPIAVMEILSKSSQKITQGSFREGAHMATLQVSHPDILEFIHCKDNSLKTDDILHNFNISVLVTDEFMNLIQEDNENRAMKFNLINPKDNTIIKSIRVREIWESICNSAWKTGDPGLIFIDRVRETEPNPNLGLIYSSNPCLISSTRMLTKDGLIQINQIHNGIFFTPEGWKHGTSWMSGNKEVVNIILSNGQSIITTPDHKFYVGEELVEANYLNNRQIQPFIGNGDWKGSEEFDNITMLKLGFIQGDGTLVDREIIINNKKYGDKRVFVLIGENDYDVDTLFEQYEYYESKPWSRYINYDDNLVSEIDKIGMEWKSLPERNLPKHIWMQSPKLVKQFLKGLYSANGFVSESYHRVSYKSTNLKLIRELQILLLALGFRPYITTNKPYEVEWPNGNYTSKQSYDLNISGYNLQKFADEIGFIQKYKNEALQKDLNNYIPTNRRNIPKVISIENVGNTEVWDFNIESNCHSGWANGFLVANCGEQMLENFSSCNLGSIDLSKHIIDKEYESKGLDNSYKTERVYDIDWEKLKNTIYLAVRFLDNVVTVNQFPESVPQLKEINDLTRRIGLGVMGWADTLSLLKIPYDSQEAVELAEKISEYITQSAWSTSEELAKEKGEFLNYKKSKLYMGDENSNPIRNSDVTTIAPTGTISILANCSSGIEPYFNYVWERKALWKEGKPQITLFEAPKFLKESLEREVGKPTTQTLLSTMQEEIRKGDIESALLVLKSYGINPELYKPAHEISPEWHIRHQAAWQKYITNSISKTINLPESATPEDISKAYLLAWQLGCKCITVYRNNSKEQVLNISVLDVPENNRENKVVNNSLLKIRPYKISGETYKVKTGHGNSYITVNSLENKPVEVFTTTGKTGGCNNAQSEAICRLICLGLKHSVPLEDIVEQLSGIICCPIYFNGTQILSIPDAIAYVLKQYTNNSNQIIEIINNKSKLLSGTKCQHCNSNNISFQEGCYTCLDCGDSKCN